MPGFMFLGLRSVDGFQRGGAGVEIDEETASVLGAELQTAFAPVFGGAVDDVDEIHYPSVFLRPQDLVVGF